MGRLKVIDFVVYRWRYSIGYIAIIAILLALLVMAGLFIPNGLTDLEKSSAIMTSDLSIQHFSPEMIINAPYHVLQKLSFYTFGVTTLSIKLPSLIIALFSAIGMLLLLRTWFKQNVAVLAALLAITTGQFLLVAQTGTPYILYIFWSIWLLLSASMVSKGVRFLFVWKVLLFMFIALSLYTPLSGYILFALACATILHPHLRYTVSELSKVKLALASLVALVIIAPIGYALYLQPNLILDLLGIPKHFPPLIDNLRDLGIRYFDFAHPRNGELMTPIFGLPSVLLIVIGLYRMFTTKYTAKSYIISGWLLLLIPLLILNPDIVSITFVPFLLLMALGIDYLIRYWYRLFPANPYARIAGLLPLVILIGSMTLSGLERFGYGYYYGKEVAASFSKDLSLLHREIDSDPQPTTVRVTPSEMSFYVTVAKYDDTKTLSVTTNQQEQSTKLIVTHDAHSLIDPIPTKVITNAYAGDADRFYIYKK